MQTINFKYKPERGVKYLGANNAILQRKCSPEAIGRTTSLFQSLPLHSSASNEFHISPELCGWWKSDSFTALWEMHLRTHTSKTEALWQDLVEEKQRTPPGAQCLIHDQVA